MFVLLFSYQKQCDFLADNVIKKHIFLFYEILQKTSKMESDLEDSKQNSQKNKTKQNTFSIKEGKK